MESYPDPIDREAIDRMVDAALPIDEQRDLLSSFDENPDGWRHLALAYMESQSLKTEFGGLIPPVAPVPALDATVEVFEEPQAPGRSSFSSPDWIITATIAVAAFAVGMVALSWWRNSGTSDDIPPIAGSYEDHRSGGYAGFEDPRARFDPHGKDFLALTLPAYDMPEPKRGGTMTYKVPLRKASPGETHNLYTAPPVISPEMRVKLKRMGHLVREERRVYPLKLKDGRQVLVPVNEIQIFYVGGRVYQ